MSPYTQEKMDQALNLARACMTLLYGGYGCGPEDPGRSTVFSDDLDKVSTSLDALLPAWFTDDLENRDPLERLRVAIDLEEQRPGSGGR